MYEGQMNAFPESKVWEECVSMVHVRFSWTLSVLQCQRRAARIIQLPYLLRGTAALACLVSASYMDLL